MTAVELLAELHQRGVTLTVAGDRLRYRAPRRALTPELRRLMARHRARLMDLITDGATLRLIRTFDLEPLDHGGASGGVSTSHPQPYRGRPAPAKSESGP